jgi:hypothetical protein
MKETSLVRFYALTAASMKMRAFWDIAPYSLVGVDRRFRGAYYNETTVRISGESPCGGGGVGSDAVLGESVLVSGLKGCYWSKTV